MPPSGLTTQRFNTIAGLHSGALERLGRLGQQSELNRVVQSTAIFKVLQDMVTAANVLYLRQF